MRRLLALCALAGCGTFEDPTIVLDLRVLAISASRGDGGALEGPEQVIDLDPAHPPTPSEVLAQLHPTTITALIADPARHRALRWSMTLCVEGDEGRCDLSRPHEEVGNGVIEDPEDSPDTQAPTADIYPDQQMLAILYDLLSTDMVRGLGGIDMTVELRIGGLFDDRVDDVFASKRLRVSPRIPAARTPNHNPQIVFLDALADGIGITMPPHRCADRLSPPTAVRPGVTVTLFPVEPGNAREHYFAPRLDGHTEALDETLTYQWLAGKGTYSDETTGGGHDVLGNQSLLGTEWHAPKREELSGPTDVSIWMIQRDERLGVSWFEGCIRVIP